METTFENTAVKEDNGRYTSFGIHDFTASIFGHSVKDIVTIKLKISEDQSIPLSVNETNDPNADYWGWYDLEENRWSQLMIFPKRFLLDMCFPYGIKSDEERGKGKSYRLEII